MSIKVEISKQIINVKVTMKTNIKTSPVIIPTGVKTKLQ
tara:strand:+ start:451 stop:567 length:117 start_codon:yes stop_codon:yes gene_type:complete